MLDKQFQKTYMPTNDIIILPQISHCLAILLISLKTDTISNNPLICKGNKFYSKDVGSKYHYSNNVDIWYSVVIF